MDPKALGHEDAARAVLKSESFSLINRFRGFGELVGSNRKQPVILLWNSR